MQATRDQVLMRAAVLSVRLFIFLAVALAVIWLNWSSSSPQPMSHFFFLVPGHSAFSWLHQ